MVLISKQEYEILYERDLDLIENYIIKTFKPTEIGWTGNGFNIKIKFKVKKEIDFDKSLKQLKDELWNKLGLMCVKNFYKRGSDIIIGTIDRKNCISILKMKPGATYSEEVY